MNRRRSRFGPVFLFRLQARPSTQETGDIDKTPKASKCISELLEAANSASSTVHTAYLTLLSFSTFLAFTTGTLSDEKLLNDRAAILPFVENIELPLSTFYIIVPWVLVLIHAETIIQFKLLADKLNALKIILRRISAKEKKHIHAQVSNFPFSHWLLGTQKLKSIGFAIGGLIWFTLIVLPLLVLVFAQLAFLPYQSEIITWFQRIAVLSDVVLLLVFYPVLQGSAKGIFAWWVDAILFGRYVFSRHLWLRLYKRYSLSRYLRVKFARRNVGAIRLLTVCGTAIFISWFVAIIPRESWEKTLIKNYSTLGGTVLNSSKAYGISYGWGRSGGHVEVPSEFFCGLGPFSIKINVYQKYDRSPSALDAAYPMSAYLPEGMVALCPTALLFHSGIPWLQGFHRTLNAHEMTIVFGKVSDDNESKLRSDDEDKRREVLAIILPIDLRGRNFRFANFSSARAPKADFRGIDATGAHFDDALLEGAKFDSFSTGLLGANFYGAKLRGANFDKADMTLASFRSAKLQGATFIEAKLYGANFSLADLSGASLSYADMLAADLTSSNMTGTRFAYVDMRMANVADGKLIAADFYSADLRGATFQRADITAAKLEGTAIDGADFTRATAQLNIINLSENRWGTLEKDEFLADMRKVGLYGLGLQYLDPTKRSGMFPKEPFHPSHCGGSAKSARTYGCIDMEIDSSARSSFAKGLLDFLADLACADHQDPIAIRSLLQHRIPTKDLFMPGFQDEYLRAAVPGFSRRLLSKKCLPVSRLDEETKSVLRDWLRAESPHRVR